MPRCRGSVAVPGSSSAFSSIKRIKEGHTGCRGLRFQPRICGQSAKRVIMPNGISTKESKRVVVCVLVVLVVSKNDLFDLKLEWIPSVGFRRCGGGQASRPMVPHLACRVSVRNKSCGIIYSYFRIIISIIP